MWILGLKGIKLLAQQENLLVPDYWTGLFSNPKTVSIFLTSSQKTDSVGLEKTDQRDIRDLKQGRRRRL